MSAVDRYINPLQAQPSKETVVMDRQLWAVVLALLALSIVMVFSATVAADQQSLKTNYSQLIKHLINIGLGVSLMIIISRVQLQWLQSMSQVVLVVAAVLVGALFVPGIGVEVNGSIRWMDFGIARFQPAELLKIATIVYFADYLSRKRDDLHLFKVGIINVALVIVALSVLLLLQPDFGSTMIIIMTVGVMLFVGGVSIRHLLFSALLVAVIMTVIVYIEPYRLARVLNFRDPWADPYGSGFQLAQALIAIGRGEWFGVGIGNSIQKLFYLPHADNDFLISIIGEELGAVGILFVLFLYTFLLFKIFAISNKALLQDNRFAGFLGKGTGLLIAIQAAINIGVNTGVLPTKGLTLPLLSNGGSSMLCMLLAIGLIFAIDRQNQTPRSQLWRQ